MQVVMCIKSDKKLNDLNYILLLSQFSILIDKYLYMYIYHIQGYMFKISSNLISIYGNNSTA